MKWEWTGVGPKMDYNYLIVVSLHFRGYLQLTQYKKNARNFIVTGLYYVPGKKSESASAILCVTDGLIG